MEELEDRLLLAASEVLSLDPGPDTDTVTSPAAQTFALTGTSVDPSPGHVAGVLDPSPFALVGQINPDAAGDRRWGDVWGEGNYAYLPADSGNLGVAIIDISDPTAPFLAATYNPTGLGGTNLRDVEVYGGIGYFASNNGGGVHIVDLSDPTNPTLLKQITSADGGNNGVHNLMVDGTILYESAFGSGTSTVRVFDVSNPSSPVHLWDITGNNAHDMIAVDGRLYTFEISGTTTIYDVANVLTQPPMLLVRFASGSGTHSGWPSPDGNVLYVAHEGGLANLQVYDISNLSSPTLVGTIENSDLNAGPVFSPHNPFVVGDLLFVSWYQAGMQLFDIGDPADPKLLGGFDTFAPETGGFNGNFGVYPRLGLDRVLLSDRSGGLFIVDVTGTAKVMEVSIRGTDWAGSVPAHSIPVGPGEQLTSLPWVNIDLMQIVFSEDVAIDQNDLSLLGVNLPDYSFNGFVYDSMTFTATWTLAAPIAIDKLLIHLNADGLDPVRGAGGKALDGDWMDEASRYPSGDGIAGGDFKFRLNVLPGDLNGDEAVNVFDSLLVRLQIGTSVGDPAFDPRRDVNPDGAINVFDALLVRLRIGDTLPAGAGPSVAGFGQLATFETVPVSEPSNVPLRIEPTIAAAATQLPTRTVGSKPGVASDRVAADAVFVALPATMRGNDQLGPTVGNDDLLLSGDTLPLARSRSWEAPGRAPSASDGAAWAHWMVPSNRSGATFATRGPSPLPMAVDALLEEQEWLDDLARDL